MTTVTPTTTVAAAAPTSSRARVDRGPLWAVAAHAAAASLSLAGPRSRYRRITWACRLTMIANASGLRAERAMTAASSIP